MKRVLHISKYYYPFSGGTEQIARDVVLALKDKCEQKIIAFNDGKEDKIEVVDGIEVTKCGCFAKVSAQSLSTTYKATKFAQLSIGVTLVVRKESLFKAMELKRKMNLKNVRRS